MSNQYITHFCGETPLCSSGLIQNILSVLRSVKVRMRGLLI